MTIIETAEKELGVTAIDGNKSNPRVLEYFAKIGQKWVTDDDTFWCAAFVGFVLEMCGIRSTRALNARSYLNWGVHTSKPVQGDVVVFWRDSIQSANGHVSFYHHEDENTVYCLGGNQLGEKVSIEGYPKTRVLDYRSAGITNAPSAPIKHMEDNTVETLTKPLPAAVKFVNFFGEDGSRATLMMDSMTLQNDGETHDFHSAEEAIEKNTSESFVFWNGVPVGVGHVTE